VGSDYGTGTTGAAADTTLPETGFEVLWMFVAAAVFAAAGLLLAALEMWLRPFPTGPRRR
jgi:hypothetical protein